MNVVKGDLIRLAEKGHFDVIIMDVIVFAQWEAE